MRMELLVELWSKIGYVRIGADELEMSVSRSSSL